MNKNSRGISIPDRNSGTSWTEKSRLRAKNRKWLGYSGRIALRIMSAMEDTPNMSQKKLAELAEVSPQHVSKIMKGQENLTLQTIAKFSEILGVELIAFPSFKYNQEIKYNALVVEGNLFVQVNFLVFPYPNAFTPFTDYQNIIFTSTNDQGFITNNQLISI